MSPLFQFQFPSKLYNHLLIVLFCVWLADFSCLARSVTDNQNKGVECLESERNALLDFKRGIRVDQCGLLHSWGITQDCCQWHGIQCHNHSGHVIALRLPTPPPKDAIQDNTESCLEGTISVSILDLKHLKYLDLSSNHFRGQIPKFIGFLSNLMHLDLSRSGFTGVVPHEIGNLTKLTYLDLNIEYPDYMRVESLRWLAQLTSVRELDLSGIDLSLTMNNWVSVVNSLPHLDALHFDDCNLSLSLPIYLSYINSSTTLGVITLSGNNLKDSSIFEWLFKLSGIETSLVYLDLSWNDELFGSNFELSRHTWNFLGNLSSLQALKLSNTNLKYDFSDIIQSLSLSSHKSLMILDLSSNQLWGSIPDNIGDLSNLRELNLASNSLKGVLTSVHLSNISKLSYLRLSHNTGLVINISTNWVPPFQLQALHLGSCKVGPDFPMWLITQKNLISIDISNASISSIIPGSFFNSLSSKLSDLVMSQNMMYGQIPNASIIFDNLLMIDLSLNNFVGTIPPFLNNVSSLSLNDNRLSHGLASFLCPLAKSSLIFLDLSNNSFSDKLPDCWGYFDNLSILRLQNNKICGNLPVSIGSLNKLSLLHLRNNNLSGELPVSLLNCTSLISLDLAHNSLSGYIPNAFGNSLKNLSILTLRNNKLFGALPSSLCYLTRLQILDVSNNRICETIPECIYNLQGMVNTSDILQYPSYDLPFSYYFTQYEVIDNPSIMWKGKEQNFQGDYSLGLIKTMDLSNNLIEGHIPEDITSLIGLVSINLSRNHLSGVIPSRIGQLTSLQSLDLSYNQLFSEIPTSLAEISYLEVLDLSYNNLSGIIPHGTQLQSFSTSAYIGNSGLCGEPLPKCHEDEGAVTPKKLKKEQSGDNFMVGVYISVVLGFIVGFWGICGTLVIKTSWRHAFFRFYDNIKDRIYVTVVVNIARVRRRT